jgi:hypothetical protein
LVQAGDESPNPASVWPDPVAARPDAPDPVVARLIQRGADRRASPASLSRYARYGEDLPSEIVAADVKGEHDESTELQ